jgi:hypothetical protein
MGLTFLPALYVRSEIDARPAGDVVTTTVPRTAVLPLDRAGLAQELRRRAGLRPAGRHDPRNRAPLSGPRDRVLGTARPLHRIDADHGTVHHVGHDRAPNLPPPNSRERRLMPAPLPKGVTLRGARGVRVARPNGIRGGHGQRAWPVGACRLAADEEPRRGAGGRASGQFQAADDADARGRVFLDRTEKALDSLRSGHRDLNALDLTELSALSLGVIEDFENEVTPTLTARLAEGMSQCAFRLQTGPSHELAARIGDARPRHRDLRRARDRPAGNGVASAGARPLYPRRAARDGR